jgi:hypothetical protein
MTQLPEAEEMDPPEPDMEVYIFTSNLINLATWNSLFINRKT